MCVQDWNIVQGCQVEFDSADLPGAQPWLNLPADKSRIGFQFAGPSSGNIVVELEAPEGFLELARFASSAPGVDKHFWLTGYGKLIQEPLRFRVTAATRIGVFVYKLPLDAQHRLGIALGENNK